MAEEEDSEPDSVVVPLDDEAKKKRRLIEDEDRERLKSSPFGDLSDVENIGDCQPEIGDGQPEPVDTGGAGSVDPGSAPEPVDGDREAVPVDGEVGGDAVERFERVREELEALGQELGVEIEGRSGDGVGSVEAGRVRRRSTLRGVSSRWVPRSV